MAGRRKPSVNKKNNLQIPKVSISGNNDVFRLIELTKSWPGEYGFTLSVPELVVRRGEKVALVGLSGCGKSTLLDLLAMVLRPDEAKKFIFFSPNGKGLDVMSAWRNKRLNSLAHARMAHIGYVLQTGGLFPFLSVRENIGISLRGLGLPANDAVEAMAQHLHIGRHLDKLPEKLSVGERQRVAIARAMAHKPSLIIADEPTASLDPINAEKIMGLFTTLADEYGVTLIIATHVWGKLGDSGFRRVEFGLKQDPDNGTVRAKVSGQAAG
ncbi:MAG: ABC transporter ATP-binding protein [Planctomycetota bacterium]